MRAIREPRSEEGSFGPVLDFAPEQLTLWDCVLWGYNRSIFYHVGTFVNDETSFFVSISSLRRGPAAMCIHDEISCEFTPVATPSKKPYEYGTSQPTPMKGYQASIVRYRASRLLCRNSRKPHTVVSQIQLAPDVFSMNHDRLELQTKRLCDLS